MKKYTRGIKIGAESILKSEAVAVRVRCSYFGRRRDKRRGEEREGEKKGKDFMVH